jgi:hypothetical protein
LHVPLPQATKKYIWLQADGTELVYILDQQFTITQFHVKTNACFFFHCNCIIIIHTDNCVIFAKDDLVIDTLITT